MVAILPPTLASPVETKGGGAKLGPDTLQARAGEAEARKQEADSRTQRLTELVKLLSGQVWFNPYLPLAWISEQIKNFASESVKNRHNLDQIPFYPRFMMVIFQFKKQVASPRYMINIVKLYFD